MERADIATLGSDCFLGDERDDVFRNMCYSLGYMLLVNKSSRY